MSGRFIPLLLFEQRDCGDTRCFKLARQLFSDALENPIVPLATLCRRGLSAVARRDVAAVPVNAGIGGNAHVLGQFTPFATRRSITDRPTNNGITTERKT